MSSSNTRSAYKDSGAISSLRYLRLAAWSGVTLFAATEQAWVQWAMWDLRGCGMAATESDATAKHGLRVFWAGASSARRFLISGCISAVFF